MKPHIKLLTSSVLLAITMVPGCDTEDPVDTAAETLRAEALARGGLSEDDAEKIETDNNPDEFASSANPSLAGNGWRRVCASDLTLKSAPHGAGGALGTLYNGWWFYKTGTDGAWSVGYSHELGLWGWVLSQYLC